MWKTWSGWLKAMGAWLAMMASGGIGAYSTAYEKIPKPPEPGFLKVCYWAVDPANGWPFIGAIVAGLGLIASLVQLFGPKPAGESLVKALARWNDERAQKRHADLQGQVWHEGQESERRDDLTHSLLTGDIVERAASAIDAGTMNNEQRVLLMEKLRQSASGQAGATAEQAERFAEAAMGLVESDSAADRAIAEEIVAGDPIEAADRLMAEVGAGKARNAERARQAARIYAPFAPSKAMDAYREAVDLDPTDLWSWIELGRLRMHYGSLADTRACFESALQRVADEWDRMVLHNEFGNVLMAEGQLRDAQREYAAGLAIIDQLAAQEPDNVEWQRDLSVNHEKLGNVAVSAGDLGAALRRYEAGLAIRERLAAREPGNAVWQRDLSVSHEKLGNVAVSAGDLGEARRRYEAGLAIRERLAAQEPGNAEWQRDLSISHENLGDVAVSAGDLGEALRRYEAGLAIRERLAVREPGNAEWQRDLSVSHNKLGDVAVSARDLGEARRRYEASQAIFERLAAREPGNAGWQRDLSVCHNKLGDVAVSAGDLGEARRRYEAGLAIVERLAAREPGNAGWQRDLFISNAKLAQLAEADGDPPGAIERFAAAETVMVALVDRWPDHPGFARDLAQVRRELARLRG